MTTPGLIDHREDNNMSWIIDMVSTISKHALSILKCIHQNAWSIVFASAGAYFCFYQFIHPILRTYKSNRSYKEAINPDRVAILSPDMKRIRAKQQETMHQKSLEAEIQRKKKLSSERERKRVMSPEEERWNNMYGGGNRLGVGKSNDHSKCH